MLSRDAALLAILAVTLLLFAWGRWRADLVALLALTAAVLSGAVPAGTAFDGFSDPAVPALAGILAIGAALRNSGLLDRVARAAARLPRIASLEVGALSTLVAAFATAMDDADAVAGFAPATRAAMRRRRRSPAPFLAAMAAASSLGGFVTLLGTGPNLLVSSVRRHAVGAGFGLLDFAPVGLAVAVAGLLLIALAWRLLPQGRDRPDPADAVFTGESYTSEVTIPPGSGLIGRPLADLRGNLDAEVAITAVIREDYRRLPPRADMRLQMNDILVLACEPDALQRFIERFGTEIVGGRSASGLDPERIGVVEAVVSPGSDLIGRSPRESALDERHRLRLLAIGRHGGRLPVRLRRTKLRAGDMLVLQGELDAMAPTLASLGCLTLAERRLRVGHARRVALPALALLGALAAAIFGLLPPAVALLAAVAVLIAARACTMSDLYDSISWPALVLFGTLLPLSAALGASGVADRLASHAAILLGGLPLAAVLGLTLLVALLATPILNGPAVALVLGPVAASLAARLGASLDPFLMAVAVGASANFVVLGGRRATPVAPGLERAPLPTRLALPLTALVAVVGAVAIPLAWPLR